MAKNKNRAIKKKLNTVLIDGIAVIALPIIGLIFTPKMMLQENVFSSLVGASTIAAAGILVFWVALGHLIDKAPQIGKIALTCYPLLFIPALCVYYRIVKLSAFTFFEFIALATPLLIILIVLGRKTRFIWNGVFGVMPFLLCFTYGYFAAVYRDGSGAAIWEWNAVLYFLSAIVFVVIVAEGVVIYLKSHREHRFFTFSKSFPVAIFISGFFLLFSVYYCGHPSDPTCGDYANISGNFFPAIFNAMQHTMRLFALDGDLISMVNSMVAGWDEEIKSAYIHYTSLLYFLAPLCTFGFALNFVKNLFGTLHYALCFGRPTHVFSELNEKTYAIANSIILKHNEKPFLKRMLPFTKPVIIFTDITSEKEDGYLELVELARREGAILLRKDLSAMSLFTQRKHHIYLLSDENEQEKLGHAAHIVRNYNNENVTLHVFSDSDLTKSFLESYSDNEKSSLKLTVKRVNDIRMLIYHELSVRGCMLFENARETADGRREINAVIVGLGRYGQEMMKALMWFCQLPGYGVNITVIDENENAIKRARSAFSGIFDTEKAEFNKDGDMRCRITHKVCAVGTDEYYEAFSKDDSFIFICLGTDELNISTARALRRKLNGLGGDPARQSLLTVIYDSDLAGKINYDADKENTSDDSTINKFRITAIGDLNSFYSYDTLLNSEMDVNGYRAHRRWDHGANSQTNYYLDDYGMHSSIASSLHKKLRDDVLTAPYSKKTAEYIRNDPYFTYVFRQTASCLRSDVLYRRAEAFVKYYSDAMAIAYHRLSGEQKSKIWSAGAEASETLDKDALLKRVLNTVSERVKADAFAILDELYRRERTDDPSEDTRLLSAASIEYLTLETVNAVKKVEEFISVPVREYLNKKIYSQNKTVYTEYEARLETAALVAAIDGDKELNASHNAPFRRWAYETVIRQCLLKAKRRKLRPSVIPRDYLTRLDEELSEYEQWTESLASVSDTVLKLFGKNVIFLASPSLVDSMTAFRQKNGGRLPASAENELKRLMDKYLKRYGIENVTYESVISDALSIIDSAAIIEHIRWNAYMRSEGFVYAKKKNVPFKAHHNLVNLSALSISDKVKDI